MDGRDSMKQNKHLVMNCLQGKGTVLIGSRIMEEGRKN